MANSVNLQNLVKHIVNGTLAHNICQICLLPLKGIYENIYATICNDDKEYCIADVLQEVCDIKISSTDEFKVCGSCFIAATQVYKFYHMARQNHEVIHFYVNEINNQINSEFDLKTDSLCITLPVILPNMVNCDLKVNKSSFKGLETKKSVSNMKDNALKSVKKERTDLQMKLEDDIVLVLNENGKPTFYKPQKDGTLTLLDDSNVNIKEFLNQLPQMEERKKRRRKRNPMEYKMCSRCPVRYRFVRKLKEHMKEEHGIDLFVCKVCQAVMEDEQEFNQHLQTHTGIHTCAICNMVFKKRETIISHFKWHEEMKSITQQEGAHVCEVCGLMFKNEEVLRDHNEKKHVKKFTCYYCGRMYKGEISFEMHIRKHEVNNDVKQKDGIKIEPKKRKRKYTCQRCGRDFVDDRALLWHERLHTNERPYLCDVCGRGFVSLNRRNQHAVCAHTAPARRCPLCPALFHLRSMVNTHVKKVHLKAHKRRNRTSKHQNVFWKTEPVPIQELSVSIQNEILELQAAQGAPQTHRCGRLQMKSRIEA